MIFLGENKFFMDALFQQIETWYNTPFGSTGTSEHSLQWMLSTQTQSITAVTGDPYRKTGLEFFFKEKRCIMERIFHRNWKPDDFIDLVIADDLLGAIDGSTSYFQITFFGRMKRHIKDESHIISIVLPSSLLRRSLFTEIVNIKQKISSHLKIHSYILFGFDYLVEVRHAN